jgi:A/G-specific adenine glycosylase
MPTLSNEQVLHFQNEILTWYTQNQRDLPWRKTRDPYHILVSEIMLQQTQVSRVIPKFEAWLKAFPTVSDLANAPTPEVLKLWSGLGYNRRALNLKKTAVVVSEMYKGEFPKTEKELLALPGIGAYTARAILCFAFNEQVAVVDTNVRKVILIHFFPEQIRQLAEESKGPGLRLQDAPASFRSDNKTISEIAEQLLPHGKAYEWNQALMDYASLVLKKEKITIPKQSTFQGSRRYYRGQILKLLLTKKTLAVNDLGPAIKKDFNKTETAWLEDLLDELIKEGFIEVKNNYVKLAA